MWRGHGQLHTLPKEEDRGGMFDSSVLDHPSSARPRTDMLGLCACVAIFGPSIGLTLAFAKSRLATRKFPDVVEPVQAQHPRGRSLPVL